jgi:hypothetical protein
MEIGVIVFNATFSNISNFDESSGGKNIDFLQTSQHFSYIGHLFSLFHSVNIRLYDKNSESDYFLIPPPKLEYFFQQHWESEYFFRKKPIPLPNEFI